MTRDPLAAAGGPVHTFAVQGQVYASRQEESMATNAERQRAYRERKRKGVTPERNAESVTEDRNVTVAALRKRNGELEVEVAFLKEQLAERGRRVEELERGTPAVPPRAVKKNAMREGEVREGHGRFCQCVGCRTQW